MYDERTRQQDHLWASLAYAQEEGRVAGRAMGIEEGLPRTEVRGTELAKEQERNMLISLIK